MFIQIQDTPNPETLKFIPNVEVLKNGETATFTAEADLSVSPMASHLLQINNVTSIFFTKDFISVTKSPEGSWDTLKTLVMSAIVDHLVAGYPIVLEKFYNRDVISNSSDDEIVRQIIDIIEKKVRPAVAEDGGDIIFERFVDGIVYLTMHGACSGCPSSTITLKSGIENMLKHYVPEVISVQAI